MGEHAPFDAPIDDIKNGIDHRPHLQLAVAPTRLWGWNQIFDNTISNKYLCILLKCLQRRIGVLLWVAYLFIRFGIRSHSASVRSVGYGVVFIPRVYRTDATYG